MDMDKEPYTPKDGTLDRLREETYARKPKIKKEELPRYQRPEQQKQKIEGWNLHEPTVHPKEKKVTGTQPSHKVRTFLLLGSTVFFIISAVIGGTMILTGGQEVSSDKIKIEIQAPKTIGGGEETSVTVLVQNNNAVPIYDAELSVVYPEGTEINGVRQSGATQKTESIGTMRAGMLESVVSPSLRFFGEEGAQKDIVIFLTYTIEGSNAEFTREIEPYSISIGTAPVVISIASPSTITAGQEYVLTATIRSNTDVTLRDLLVSVDYPTIFTVRATNPDPIAAKNIWRFDLLEPGEEKEITIHGTLAGDDRVVYPVSVTAGLSQETNPLSITSVLGKGETDVLVEASFINVDLTIGSETEPPYVFSLGETERVEVTLTNTLSTPIYNVGLEVHFGGSAYVAENISYKKGYFDVHNDTLLVDPVEDASFKRIDPGESRTVVFRVKPAAVSGQTPEFTISTDVSAARTDDAQASQDVYVATDATISFVGSYAAASIATPKVGPYPPKVEEESKYAILFSLEGGNEAYTDVVFNAMIPRGVTITSILPNGMTFDTDTRMLAWDIGLLSARTIRTAELTLSYTPTKLDVGTQPILIRDQEVEGVNTVSNKETIISLPQLSTQIADDILSGKVVQ